MRESCIADDDVEENCVHILWLSYIKRSYLSWNWFFICRNNFFLPSQATQSSSLTFYKHIFVSSSSFFRITHGYYWRKCLLLLYMLCGLSLSHCTVFFTIHPFPEAYFYAIYFSRSEKNVFAYLDSSTHPILLMVPSLIFYHIVRSFLLLSFWLYGVRVCLVDCESLSFISQGRAKAINKSMLQGGDKRRLKNVYINACPCMKKHTHIPKKYHSFALFYVCILNARLVTYDSHTQTNLWHNCWNFLFISA